MSLSGRTQTDRRGGLLLRDALAQSTSATGLDQSEEMVELARERAPEPRWLSLAPAHHVRRVVRLLDAPLSGEHRGVRPSRGELKTRHAGRPSCRSGGIRGVIERTITLATARRLALRRQRLARPSEPAADGIVGVVRDLGCLQLDPIAVVARSHLLVLWSRLGAFDPVELDRLLWEDRRLFEYWAHAASIVLTEDYPIHSYLMRRYGSGNLKRHQKLRAWLEANEPLRRSVLRELRRRGPVRSRDLAGGEAVDWVSGGWTRGRNVTQMLDYLWTKGRIMVVRRDGLEKYWDLSERFLPDWTPRQRLSEREVTRRAAQRSLRALGVATVNDIRQHFTPGRYPELPSVLGEFERAGRIVRVRVVDEVEGDLPGRWFLHQDDLPAVEDIERGDWQPRTTLLSPFDNLIRDRARTEALFGFDYRIEIYVPRADRRYGYYVLPILHGDRLIGRVDPAMDRSTGTLRIHALHVEPGVPTDGATARAVSAALEDLATFLGATSIDSARGVPRGWIPR
jgi:uncharacterized protein YcaQ